MIVFKYDQWFHRKNYLNVSYKGIYSNQISYRFYVEGHMVVFSLKHFKYLLAPLEDSILKKLLLVSIQGS